MERYDIIVVGAGPAGATFARIADSRLRILLLDGNKSGKPCGGLLAPDGQKALAHFDLNLPKEILADPQIFSVKTIDLKGPIHQWYQRMYVNLDRNRFDQWLLSLVPNNVEVIRGNCRNLERMEDDQIRVDYSDSSGNLRVACAPFLVGADGANSKVRRTFFPPLKTRSYVAIQQWFRAELSEAHPFYSCIFDEETSDCCSWTVSKDNILIFGGAFPRKHCRKRFEQQKEKLKAAGIHLDSPIKTEACLVLRPTGWKSFCLGSENIFLIGEAAGFISPSSLEGISYAMNSAVKLNKSIQAGSKNALATYKRKTRGIRIQLLAKNIKCLFMYGPMLRKIVLKSGFASMDMYADAHKNK
jgi:flavin-dependent dehydrogenase